MSAAPPSGTITFVFTDIEGSTRLWDAHPDEMRAALARHDSILRGAFEGAGGYVFKTVGDAFCVAFSTPTSALSAVLQVQRRLRDEDWGVTPIRIRVGLHTGTAEERDSDYFGPTLNRVARLQGITHGGQVLLSLATAELLRDVLPNGARLRDLGTHRLKDLGRPEHVFQLVVPDLPADFPPPSSLEASPNNLPAQLTSFIGRQAQVTEVAEHIQQHRLVTLLGAGGMGKTRTSLQAAAELIPEFAAGVWFVALAPVARPELVPGAVGSAMSVHEQPGHPLLATLKRALNRRILLVLDNCEQVTDAVAELVAELLAACPELKVLATSREALRLPGEDVVRLPPMQDAEAIELFAVRAAAAKPGFVVGDDADVVLQICEGLDGMPLAIELAAARVAALSPSAILDRLDDRFRLLRSRQRGIAARQKTLSALIDWSHELLDADERAVFRRLSLLEGTFTVEGATVVAAGEPVDAFDIIDIVEELAAKSLLVPVDTDAGPRFFMLDSLRAYGRLKLDEAGERSQAEAARRAWIEAWLQQAGEAVWTPRQRRATQQLLEEINDLRAVFAGMDDASLMAFVGQKAVALLGLTGHATEGLAMYERALAHEAAAPEELQVMVRFGQGAMAMFGGRPVLGMEALEHAVTLGEKLGHPIGHGLGIGMRGHLKSMLGDLDGAEADVLESIELLDAVGFSWGVARGQSVLADVALVRGDLDTALSYVESALAGFSAVASTEGMAFANVTRAEILMARGDLDGAARSIHEAISLFHTERHFNGLIFAISVCGVVLAEKGDVRSAAIALGAVDELLARLGYVVGPREARNYERLVAAVPDRGDRASGSAMPTAQAVAVLLRATG